MDDRLGLLEKLKLKLSGNVYVGKQMKEGWKESLPFYAFKCPKHGIVKSYTKGYENKLECPNCIEEEKKKVIIETRIRQLRK